LLREKLNSAFKKISQYEEYLANRLRCVLKQMNHIKLFQADENIRIFPTIAYKVSGMHSKRVCHYLATHYSLHLEFCHFYELHLNEKLAANENGGLIRAGISPYNTEEEIDRLIHALAKLN